MGRLSGIMGGLHGLANWFMRLSVVNLFWFIVNLPIFVIILSALQHEELGGKMLYMIPAVIFIPFILFPSTTAMFAIVRDWVLQNEQDSLWRTYFSYIKTNYKSSMISGLIWSVIWLIAIIDVNYFLGKKELLTIFFIILAIFLLLTNIIFFSIQVHYDMRIKELFKNSFFVAIGSPLLLISLFIVILLVVIITRKVWFFLPFFSGTICTLL